ncbi:hypothetical protein Tco_1216953 [Tanacetum coccineum]
MQRGKVENAIAKCPWPETTNRKRKGRSDRRYYDLRKCMWAMHGEGYCYLDRQSKRTIQTLKDMLRASPVLWAKIGESSLIRLELVQETIEKVVLIKEKLKAARDRQKSYADNRRKSLELEVRDKVLLKVSPWKGVMRFGKKGKLAPRYVGLFEILERIGLVAYRLRFPNELSEVPYTSMWSEFEKYLAELTFASAFNEIRVRKNTFILSETRRIWIIELIEEL